MPRPAFEFEDHGSLWLCRPTSDVGRRLLETGCSDEAQWWGGALVVEPRYVEEFVERLKAGGFSVKRTL